MRLPHSRWLWFAVLFGLFCTLLRDTPTYAAPESQPAPLVVATRVIEPFVIQTPGGLSGFSIDLWNEISRRSGLQFEYVVVDTIDELLNIVRNNEADLAIAAISMTPERETDLDFSYPIFNSGLQLIIRIGGGGWLNVLSNSIIELLGIVLGLVFIMALIAHLIWFIERGRNPDFSTTYWPGVWEAFYWAGVTLSTVGYGDKAPRTNRGRALTLIWIFVGLFLVANFTARVASQLTLAELQNDIEGVSDLPNRRVVTVANSTAAEYLAARNIAYRGVDHIDDAFTILRRGEADALIYDAPVLRYRINQFPDRRLQVVGDMLQSEPYGIALPENSTLRETLNQVLLEMISDGTYNRIYQRYFQNE
ncbi:MAG: transporter substrate-binding domain-containing protein [Oscillochloris sp.]|nr:transporter substrate-binding domain-containing protein [Oscillochloris sp.]